ncbi:MAG TPA: GNAT family N-acetyltransferase [Ignavibacteriaceae bacterium]
MDHFVISDDKSKLDVKLIHNFLTNSYWGNGRTLEEVNRSIEHSFCFGIYSGNKQVGFARVLTDFVIFAYLMDVFIIEEYRGRGLSKILLERIFNDVRFSKIKKWMLATDDAHTLYEKFGFKMIEHPEKLMSKSRK